MSLNPLPLLISAAGIYLIFKLRLFFILHPIRTLRLGRSAIGTPRELASFTLALAGTLGVGNVFGVAVGIMIGGAGSVFWLLVSVLFSSVIKYCEVTLASDNSSATGGGMFYAIRNTYPKYGVVLSCIYAIACLALGIVMGAALQTHTVSSTYAEIFDTPPTLVPWALLIVVLLAVLRDRRFISRLTLFIIPLTTVVYVSMTFSVILAHLSEIPSVTRLILYDAFTPKGAVGGGVAFLFSRAAAEGYSRGILSNEAGAGTSTIAHTTVDGAEPAARGVLGIFEVLFDTALLCMLTAYAILLSVPDPALANGGMALVLAALETSLGRASPYLLFISVLAFAYSTVVCWYYYAAECVRQLLGREPRALFLLVFASAILLGGTVGESTLVLLSDILLLVLSLLSLPTVLKNSDRVKALSESSGLIGPRIK